MRKLIRTILPLTLLIGSPMLLFGQEKIDFKHGCHFMEGVKSREYFISEPSDEALRVLEEILNASSISSQQIKLKVSNIDNAAATELNGVLYILISQEFIRKIEQDAASKWAVYGVLAHEVGHHLLRHRFEEADPEERKKMELAADDYAGRILNTLCAEEDQALAALSSITYRHSPNYPSLRARREMLSNGWFQQGEDWRKQGKNPCGQIINLAFGHKYGNRNKATNVEALVKKESMVITYDAVPRLGQLWCYSYLTVSAKSRMSPTSIEWKTDPEKYGDRRRLIWHFAKDGYTDRQVSKAQELGIGVFEKPPRRVDLGGYATGIGSILAGGGLVAWGYAKKNDALEMHNTYAQIRDPNDPAYAQQSRQALYNDANGQYRSSQVIRGIGWSLIGGGVVWLIDKFFDDKRAKIGRLYVGEQGVEYAVPFYGR